jgi:hypothetical protein
VRWLRQRRDQQYRPSRRSSAIHAGTLSDPEMPSKTPGEFHDTQPRHGSAEGCAQRVSATRQRGASERISRQRQCVQRPTREARRCVRPW